MQVTAVEHTKEAHLRLRQPSTKKPENSSAIPKFSPTLLREESLHQLIRGALGDIQIGRSTHRAAPYTRISTACGRVDIRDLRLLDKSWLWECGRAYLPLLSIAALQVRDLCGGIATGGYGIPWEVTGSSYSWIVQQPREQAGRPPRRRLPLCHIIHVAFLGAGPDHVPSRSYAQGSKSSDPCQCARSKVFRIWQGW